MQTSCEDASWYTQIAQKKVNYRNDRGHASREQFPITGEQEHFFSTNAKQIASTSFATSKFRFITRSN